jgi:hypothetical protein
MRSVLHVLSLQQGGSSLCHMVAQHAGPSSTVGRQLQMAGCYCAFVLYPRRPVAGGGGFKAPLTRMVCTPCYRAPEVRLRPRLVQW